MNDLRFHLRSAGAVLSAVLSIALCASCSAPDVEPRVDQETSAVATSVAALESAVRIEIPNVRQPVPGVLTGGQPTPELLEQAAAAGYRTVINLRTPAELTDIDEAGSVAQLGMTYVHIPISGPDDINETNALALAEALEAPGAAPVLVHCASGNRVGALLAAKAFLVDGAEPEQAYRLGRDAGLTKLDPAVRALLGLSDSLDGLERNDE